MNEIQYKEKESQSKELVQQINEKKVQDKSNERIVNEINNEFYPWLTKNIEYQLNTLNDSRKLLNKVINDSVYQPNQST